MKLTLKNNNYNRCMVLFPGWTFDYKIFPDFSYNIIYYDNIDLNNYINIINKFLIEKEIDEVYLLGWSMGNFLINKLLPYLKSNVIKIFLISPVKKFNLKYIKQSENLLKKDFKKALAKFYRNIFIGDKVKYKFFLENFYEYYLNRATPEMVYSELEFIKNYVMNIENFKNYNIEIITSKKDIITPYTEVLKLKNELTSSCLYTTEYTHTPFLYNEVINELNKK